jgi:hypothetical protein
MEFDHFGLSVKVLITKRVLARYDSTGPLYTLSLAASSTPTHVFSCMPWLLLLPPLPDIIVSVTPAPTPSPSCRAAHLSPILEVEMIPCVMPVSLVGMFGCLFLVPLPVLSDPLPHTL